MPRRPVETGVAKRVSFEERDLALREEAALDRRRQLWRDSATILIGIVFVLLVFQVLGPRGTGVIGDAASASQSGDGLEALPPRASLPPGQTFGAVLDPSLGIDATPTPIVARTLPPTGTSAPRPTPKPTPRTTPRPTHTSTPPTAPPTPEPTPLVTPEATPPPAPPTAAFSWSQGLPLTIDFTNGSSGETSWLWDFGDGETSTLQNPNHTYPSSGEYTVRLTVTGPGGTDFIQHLVSVSLT